MKYYKINNMYLFSMPRSKNLRGIKTGQYRIPLKGEWYLSGAIPECYKAENDLLSKYHIMKIVGVKIETAVRIVNYNPILDLE